MTTTENITIRPEPIPTANDDWLITVAHDRGQVVLDVMDDEGVRVRSLRFGPDEHAEMVRRLSEAGTQARAYWAEQRQRALDILIAVFEPDPYWLGDLPALGVHLAELIDAGLIKAAEIVARHEALEARQDLDDHPF